MLIRAIRDSWPLFFGILLLMMANGLMLTLLTIRASALGFSNIEVGIMQSAYPIAALLGCIVAPRIVATVGHARAFGALASICSVTALVHMVTSDFYTWTAMRALAGFCFPGLYVVSESWLNARVRNETRASLLSVYFVVQVGGSALGQMLLNVPDESGMVLFVIASVFVSLSLVPMLLSPTDAGEYVAPARISMMKLMNMSPFGFIGSLLNGVSQALLYVGMGIVAVALGASGGDVGLAIAALSVGAALGQFPIGALSDRTDRRLVAVGLALVSLLLLAYLALTLSETGINLVSLLILGICGATIVPIYSLCIAHTNDTLKPEQVVPATGALVLVLNVGIAIGPVIASFSIDHAGVFGFFAAILGIQGLFATLGIWRMVGGRQASDTTMAAVPVSQSATGDIQRINQDDTAAGRDER